jgi:hypothetical protein
MPPTYATRNDCLSYTAGLTIVAGEEAAFDKLIERAEQDVDEACGDWPLLPVILRKFDAAALSAVQKEALKRATCAQVEFRITLGDQHFRSAQHAKVRGPEFSVEGQLPRIGPKTMRELAGSGLVKVWRTVRPPSPAA